VAAALEGIQKTRLAGVEVRLAVVDKRLRELAPVKAPVDSYQAAKARYEAQVRWIETERQRQRCPGVVLADLDLDRRAALVDSVALEGTTLAVVGRAESDADVSALAASVREAEWARAVRAGRRPGRGSGGDGVRFGLVATVELPPCRAPETPAPPGVTER